ncbi:serine protease snake-like [Bradysia coprophila]|uniref:serine protease snake-like n=1 Tax=Bradysia coprophila TaxID=38358 RepID=UPI00187D9311|nr:serine protease snake-like [Bradysia coprophila]
MWTSGLIHLYCIVVLNVANQGVLAEYEIRSFFYPSPRIVPSWRLVGDRYNNRIFIASQPTPVHFSYSGDQKSIGDSCYTNSLVGVCTLTSKCPGVLQDIRNGKNPTVCSYQISEAIVCCPIPNNSNNPTYQQESHTTVQHNQNSQIKSNLKNHREPAQRRSEQKCEEYSRLAARPGLFTSLSILASTQRVNIPTCLYSTGLIVGGEVSKPGEFPHMAAVGWTTDSKIDWKCGGSLISEHFILTAGHCSSAYGILPDIVRLGDQNLVRQDDGADPQEYQIESVIAHPNYRHSSNYYDIALLRLNRQVTFTRFVRPACIWQSYSINSTKAVATGWGQVEFAGDRSDDLRKVSLNIIDYTDCRQLYETSKKLRRGIVKSQLCAGHLQGGKDTCHGDSGGPVQIITPKNQCVFHIIGITSFGKACAAVNTAAVYTRVSSYVDWIESVVWPA